MNGVVKNISGLAIETTSQLVALTKGQKLLLKCVRDCVAQQKPMTWDLIVLIYVEGVRATYWDRWFLDTSGRPREYSVLEEYQKQSATWTYTLRAMVRGWLLSNIGILVLKNQLIIIPTMELGE